MSQPETDVITQAQELIRSKQLPKAQRLLVEYIKKNPNSEQAWYVLSTAVDDPRKQIECLQRVLRINPANTEAQTRLMKVMAAQAAPPPPAPPSHAAPITRADCQSAGCRLRPRAAAADRATCSAISAAQPIEPPPRNTAQPIETGRPPSIPNSPACDRKPSSSSRASRASAGRASSSCCCWCCWLRQSVVVCCGTV